MANSKLKVIGLTHLTNKSAEDRDLHWRLWALASQSASCVLEAACTPRVIVTVYLRVVDTET